MALPAGVSTVTVKIRVPIDVLGGDAKAYSGTISADRALVWEATGEPIWPVPANLPAPVGGWIEFDVPLVDQAGMVNGEGTPVTGWVYTLRLTGTWSGAMRTVSKQFQVTSGSPDPTVVDVLLADSVDPGITQPSYLDQIRGYVDQAQEIAGLTGEDEAVALLIGDDESATAAALAAATADIATDDDGPVVEFNDGRYVPRGALPERPALEPTPEDPSYWAHRAGFWVYPEESAEAYAACFAAGLPVLDGDCLALGDGALALIHDETVDRTTDGTGEVTDYTVPTWLTLNAAANFPWPRATPPALLGDLLSQYAPSTYLSIEPKSIDVLAAMLDLADRTGSRDALIINTRYPSHAAAAKLRGYKVYFYWGSNSTGPNADGVGGTGPEGAFSIADAVAAGVDFFGCDGFGQAGSIEDLVATGIPVIPWNINTRRWATIRLGQGCSGFLTDQPVYLQHTAALARRDSWARGVFGHGLSAYPINPTATNATVDEGALVLTGAASGQYLVVGEVSPVADPAGTYTIDVDMGTDVTDQASGKAVLLSFCLPDDGPYDLSNGANANPHPAGGYMAYLRTNGVLSIFEFNNTGSAFTTVGGNLNTDPLVADDLAHVRVTVTPSDLTVCRTDDTTVTTASNLTSGVAITSIPCAALPRAVGSGTRLLLPTGQYATVSSTAAASATSIAVSSITPSSTVPSGTALPQALVVSETTTRGGYVGVGRTGLAASTPSRYKSLVIT